jgi:hypothetical protein
MRTQGSSKEKIKTDMFGFRTEGNSPEGRGGSIFAARSLSSTEAFPGYHRLIADPTASWRTVA